MNLVLALPTTVPQRDAAREARLRAMVDHHFDAVWRALRRLGVPDAAADDASQQVFLVALRRLEEIEGGGERAYLLGIALRVASDARRTLRRRREVPIDDEIGETLSARAAHPVDTPDAVLEQRRAMATLTALLDELPQEMREAFVLFDLEELTAVEVARVLGVPVGTVASRVRRARERFRKSLTARGGL